VTRMPTIPDVRRCSGLHPAVAAPAVAGPPPLCHPFDIGSAPSPPWNGADNWCHTALGVIAVDPGR